MDDFLIMTIVVAVFVMILFYIFAAVEFSKIAEIKGYPEKKTIALWFCLLVPFAGYLFVCALPDNGHKMISKAPDAEVPAQIIHEEKLEDQEQLPQL